MYNLEQLGKVRLLKVILKYAKEIMDERKYKKKLQTTQKKNNNTYKYIQRKVRFAIQIKYLPIYSQKY